MLFPSIGDRSTLWLFRFRALASVVPFFFAVIFSTSTTISNGNGWGFYDFKSFVGSLEFIRSMAGPPHWPICVMANDELWPQIIFWMTFSLLDCAVSLRFATFFFVRCGEGVAFFSLFVDGAVTFAFYWCGFARHFRETDCAERNGLGIWQWKSKKIRKIASASLLAHFVCHPDHPWMTNQWQS